MANDAAPVSFVVGRYEPRINLGLLFFAALLLDFLLDPVTDLHFQMNSKTSMTMTTRMRSSRV